MRILNLLVPKLFLVANFLVASSAWADTRIEVYSEAGYWGDRIVREVYAPSVEASRQLINHDTLKSENLNNRVSSIRLVCDEQRSAKVYVSDIANSSTNRVDWRGNTVFATCQPGQTVEINLHDKKAYPNRQSIADRARSILVVVDRLVNQDASVITLFSEAGFWGREYRFVVNGEGLITPPELYSLNLHNSISSVRMTCGKYGQLLDLYKETDFKQREKTLSCLPGQTKEYNLHNIRGESGFYLGDLVKSAINRTILP